MILGRVKATFGPISENFERVFTLFLPPKKQNLDGFTGVKKPK
jgi:hypothetical protein